MYPSSLAYFGSSVELLFSNLAAIYLLSVFKKKRLIAFEYEFLHNVWSLIPFWPSVSVTLCKQFIPLEQAYIGFILYSPNFYITTNCFC